MRSFLFSKTALSLVLLKIWFSNSPLGDRRLWRKDDDDAVLPKQQKWLWSWFWRGGNASEIPVGKNLNGPA